MLFLFVFFYLFIFVVVVVVFFEVMLSWNENVFGFNFFLSVYQFDQNGKRRKEWIVGDFYYTNWLHYFMYNLGNLWKQIDSPSVSFHALYTLSNNKKYREERQHLNQMKEWILETIFAFELLCFGVRVHKMLFLSSMFRQKSVNWNCNKLGQKIAPPNDKHNHVTVFNLLKTN